MHSPFFDLLEIEGTPAASTVCSITKLQAMDEIFLAMFNSMRVQSFRNTIEESACRLYFHTRKKILFKSIRLLCYSMLLQGWMLCDLSGRCCFTFEDCRMTRCSFLAVVACTLQMGSSCRVNCKLDLGVLGPEDPYGAKCMSVALRSVHQLA